jgi:3-methylcrotonyl-CoA carboxylase alpha subunit
MMSRYSSQNSSQNSSEKKKKLLVANRSEIACRIFQTCREMGITTIGIYAPGDEDARHVTFADEVAEVSAYLNADAILKVAKDLGADLIHPGYGFLSERPAFAEAVEAAGITFVGPRAETMRLMGEKIASKKFADEHTVPTLPWVKVKEGEDLRPIAKRIGFPLLLKASAGGGGKGMRRVNEESELEAAAESASAEARSAFGDGALFIEKLVLEPRHIEVQVFGDGKGQGIHLYERECSLQRRHQKIWEEAPAPHLSKKTKAGLYQAALQLVEATQYKGAGTVEFLVDEKENFYFLEMNTRLQVEHPVTEMITGLDLVKLQIEEALLGDDFKLPEVRPAHGAAIEVRLYAEDPAKGFLPTPGKVKELIWPQGSGIRVESGIEKGQEVNPQFDSMLAKLIVSGVDRDQAVAKMKEALKQTVIFGLGTNQSYLLSIAEHPKVKEGKVTTAFLEKEFSNFFPILAEEDLELLSELHDSAEFRGQGGSLQKGSNKSILESPWEKYRTYDSQALKAKAEAAQ